MPAKHEPSPYNRKMVSRYAASGTSHESIANIIGVTRKTLAKHYDDELATASDKANGLVAGKLFSNAMDGNVTAQIFWLKTRARWRETDSLLGDTVDEVKKVTVEFNDARKRK